METWCQLFTSLKANHRYSNRIVWSTIQWHWQMKAWVQTCRDPLKICLIRPTYLTQSLRPNSLAENPMLCTRNHNLAYLRIQKVSSSSINFRIMNNNKMFPYLLLHSMSTLKSLSLSRKSSPLILSTKSHPPTTTGSTQSPQASSLAIISQIKRVWLKRPWSLRLKGTLKSPWSSYLHINSKRMLLRGSRSTGEFRATTNTMGP